jgi:hypothetical protein
MPPKEIHRPISWQETLAILLNCKLAAEQFAKEIEGIDHGKEWAQCMRPESMKFLRALTI